VGLWEVGLLVVLTVLLFLESTFELAGLVLEFLGQMPFSQGHWSYPSY